MDEALTRHQVAYLGLVENVRVRRAGFAYRQDYDKALARYKMLCPKTWPSWKGRPKDGIKEILKVSATYTAPEFPVASTVSVYAIEC